MKIAIVGNGGGGKTTAGCRLSRELGIPLYSVDQVQFEPGWQRASDAAIEAWHAPVLSQENWILDGWGSWDLIDARFEACDTILFVDYPLEIHLALAQKRSEMHRQGQDVAAPPGCAYHEVDDLMEQTLRRVDSALVPILREKVAAMVLSKTVVKVTDPSAMEVALADLINLAPSGYRQV